MPTFVGSHRTQTSAQQTARSSLKEDFMRETNKNLPEGWNYDEDGETTLDKDD